MSYKVNRDDEHIVIPDGPVTAREVRKLMKQKKTPEFYELEAAEVINCLMRNYEGLTPERIVSHADIAPNRKTDPGPLFDWKRLKTMIK